MRFSFQKIMLSHANIDMKDISNVFFDTIQGISNMRYFNAQQLMAEHWEEE